jgi:hypothetical protein
MIAQPELHNLLILPVAERLRIAQRLIESALAETGDKASALPEPKESSTGGDQIQTLNPPLNPPPNPLLAVAGMFSGKPVNTAEMVDEICLAEVDRRSGFTTKPPLED